MAFCNSCGTTLESGAKFCAKCGTVIAGGPVAPSYPVSTPAATPQSSSAVKIALIVVGALVLLGIFGTVAATLIGVHLARRTRIETSDGKVRVQSPLGTVETTKDPAEAAKELGIDVYPGAHALQDGAAAVNIGGARTVAANFETGDPPEKVADFYRSKFPNAKVSASDGKNYSIVATQDKNLITINIDPQGDKTMIHIASVRGSGVVIDGGDKD